MQFYARRHLTLEFANLWCAFDLFTIMRFRFVACAPLGIADHAGKVASSTNREYKILITWSSHSAKFTSHIFSCSKCLCVAMKGRWLIETIREEIQQVTLISQSDICFELIFKTFNIWWLLWLKTVIRSGRKGVKATLNNLVELMKHASSFGNIH